MMYDIDDFKESISKCKNIEKGIWQYITANTLKYHLLLQEHAKLELFISELYKEICLMDKEHHLFEDMATEEGEKIVKLLTLLKTSLAKQYTKLIDIHKIVKNTNKSSFSEKEIIQIREILDGNKNGINESENSQRIKYLETEIEKILITIERKRAIMNQKIKEEILPGKTLYSFNTFEQFKNWLKVGMEFDLSSKISKEITLEFVKQFGIEFDDSYPPHLKEQTVHHSVFSKISKALGPYAHGVATLSIVTGFVRRLYEFKDNSIKEIFPKTNGDFVELITPGFRDVQFHTPNPAGSIITGKFKVVNIKYENKIFGGEKYPVVKVDYKITLYSNLVTNSSGEYVPVCTCVWTIWYINSYNQYFK
jgi:acyl dehydratase